MIPKTRTDINYYLDVARELSSKIEAAADRIDADRQLPADISSEMAERGLFRLLLPRELGGAELDHPDFLRILRIFAAVDASAAWCVNQNNVFTTAASTMNKEAAHEVWDDKMAVVTNGPPSSSARAVRVEGGYRISGRWDFSSGIDHATWVAALAPMEPASPASPAPGATGDVNNARLIAPTPRLIRHGAMDRSISFPAVCFSPLDFRLSPWVSRGAAWRRPSTWRAGKLQVEAATCSRTRLPLTG